MSNQQVTNGASTNDGTVFLSASENAFHAYRIIYYPLFGKGGILDVPENIEVSDVNVARALTVQENLVHATPYKLSETSIAALALAYQVLDDDPRFENLFDPAATVMRFLPDLGNVRPMYPDFPSQVLEISEEQFRIDQARHYMSTYGVELLTALMGCPIEVAHGWLPEDPGTEKTKEDDSVTDKQIVNLVLSEEEMRDIVEKDLARPARMHESAASLAAELFSMQSSKSPLRIGFHENMLSIIDKAKDSSSRDLEHVLESVCQHPGDVFKAILHLLYKEEEVAVAHPRYSWQTVVKSKRVNTHLTTKQKKALCRTLETFDEMGIARNLADGTDKFMFAANALSISRFGGPRLKKAHQLVSSGAVKSWNAEAEGLWLRLALASGDDGKADAKRALLSKYGTRPGVFLRSMTRFIKNGFTAPELEEELHKHAESYSTVSLVRLCTQTHALDIKGETDWAGRAVDVRSEVARIAEQHDIKRSLADTVKILLEKKLQMAQTPIKGKKVYMDPCGFSLKGSVLMPNDVGNTAEAYPPAGMAYDVPDDKVVRFFVFWNDQAKRVDIDSHFYGEDVNGRDIHVGWNSDFRRCGTVFSGDVTHSDNAVEYLDIDMPVAREEGLAFVNERLNIYNSSAAPNWRDIDTCFCGALVVGSTEPDVKVYNGKNVIFHDDLTGNGSNMEYAFVNVENHYVRILRGSQFGFNETGFTLGDYIDLLVDAQGATLVSEKEDADVVVGVGRLDDENSICLIDEGFFMG